MATNWCIQKGVVCDRVAASGYCTQTACTREIGRTIQAGASYTMEEKYVELGKAISNIAYYNGHEEWLWKIADEIAVLPEGIIYPCCLDPSEWYTDRHALWMMLVSAFGEWGTSIRSGWIDRPKECAAFINEITERFS